MPIYEYRCSSCGHELEAMQKFSDPVLTSCPACRADALVKLVSAAGFQLKGGGWYATDFRGGNGKATPDAGKPEGGDKTPEGGGKTPDKTSDGPAKAAASCGTNCACH